MTSKHYFKYLEHEKVSRMEIAPRERDNRRQKQLAKKKGS